MPRQGNLRVWTVDEGGLSVYLLARGFEPPDVAQIVSYRLHRPSHDLESVNKNMNRINELQIERGLSPLCLDGMSDWNIFAVDDFLLGLTDDTEWLEDLLWFHAEYIPLLQSVRLHTGLSWTFYC